jgi:hypothetical protein
VQVRAGGSADRPQRPPGIGESTLARRFVEAHPLTLALEQDVVRGLLGGWRTRETDSGPLPRQLCLGMARTHLLAKRDVTVPQFVALPAYLAKLVAVAAEAKATYVGLVLHHTAVAADRRFHARLQDPLWAGTSESLLRSSRRPAATGPSTNVSSAA